MLSVGISLRSAFDEGWHGVGHVETERLTDANYAVREPYEEGSSVMVSKRSVLPVLYWERQVFIADGAVTQTRVVGMVLHTGCDEPVPATDSLVSVERHEFTHYTVDRG